MVEARSELAFAYFKPREVTNTSWKRRLAKGSWEAGQAAVWPSNAHHSIGTEQSQREGLATYQLDNFGQVILSKPPFPYL